MKLLNYALAATLAMTACAQAQTYNDSGGTIVPGFVPLAGCSAGGNCTGPASKTNPNPSVLTSQYPAGATPSGSSALATTGATFASLAAVAGQTQYLCGFSIDADATAATVVAATIVGLSWGTFRIRQGVGAVASGTINTTKSFNPCIPASAANTAISLTPGLAGTGGNVAIDIWGYQQ